MKIALIGSRGIPARYSGFEQFYEQFAVRLAERGHEVTVYNRSHFIKDVKKEYKGVRIVSLPSVPTKHLDTITHTALSSLHALFQGYDIVYYCIVGNSPLCWIPRMVGAKTLINVDGADWARDKWSGFAKTYQKWCERVACACANAMVADAKGILERYRKLYDHETIFVPYGANIRTDLRADPNVAQSAEIRDQRSNIKDQRSDSEGQSSDLGPLSSDLCLLTALKKWNLSPDGYIFYVGRFVPENAIDLLIRSFKKLKTDKKLVIVGDAPYADEFKKSLHELAGDDDRIVFTGYAFGDDYAQLSANAYFYVQPAGIDGTRPALLDQMGFGNCVLVRNSTVNMEVIGDCGCFFDKERLEESLVEVMQDLVEHPEKAKGFRAKVTSRIENYYNWEWVTSFYEDLFQRLKEKRPLAQYDEYVADKVSAQNV
ncbi:MAG: glycosyltransferase [Kiritimatiellaeota bacterium]|nr:glycosyltransferase [Kiritimatiellota bacterium]